MHRLKSVWDEPKPACVRTPDSSVFSVSIIEFSTALFALVAGNVLAILVLLCEIVMHRCGTNNHIAFLHQVRCQFCRKYHHNLQWYLKKVQLARVKMQNIQTQKRKFATENRNNMAVFQLFLLANYDEFNKTINHLSSDILIGYITSSH